MIKLSDKNEILVKNKYYPDGLRENEVVKYHHKNKSVILNEIGKSRAVLCIATDINKYVILRKFKGRDIYLTENNFDVFIHSRIISIFKEMNYITNEWCIDIDAGIKTPENKIKETVSETLNVFRQLYELGWIDNLKENIRIVNTSTGYHVLGYMKKRESITNCYEDIKYFFADLKNKYYKERGESNISIDFSVMKPRGCRVVVGSLNRNGLACLDVTKYWKSFERFDAIIKNKD